MPLTGFLCDLNPREEVSFDECLACARAAVPPRGRRCRFTATMLAALAASSGGRADAGISATSVNGCLRRAYLDATQPYHQQPIKLWPALRGTLFHALFERAGDGVDLIRERRICRDVAGITITGKPDEVAPGRGILVDYKTVKGEIPEKVPEAYEVQLNIYRWLLADGRDRETDEPVKIDIRVLGIIFVTMGTVAKRVVPVWSLDRVEDYLQPRAEALRLAFDADIWPDRIVPDPTQRTLCRDWCPHYAACLEYEDD